MLKAVSLVALGIVIGIVATLGLRGEPDAAAGGVDRADNSSFNSPSSTEAATDAPGLLPETDAAPVVQQNSRLDEAEIEATDSETTGRSRQANVMPRVEDIVPELVAAGFNSARAEAIRDLYIQVLVESAAEADSVEAYSRSPLGRLREELGDAEFGRYLDATNYVNGVEVWGIVETSPVALAGLRAGDRIVSYDGKRVFDWREVDGINGLSTQGTIGEAVIVEVIRDGEPLQILLPRGSLEAAALYSGGLGRGISCEVKPDQPICRMGN
jgi:membrane-associated protease RseP (regulator of RpoE activity)